MASREGVRNLLNTLRAYGLDYGPRGEPGEVVAAWHSLLDRNDCTDGMLLWAAQKWQLNGNTGWPKPMQIREMIAEKRNEVARDRLEEQGQKGCFACRWTGTRTVVRHLLMARWPIEPADLDLTVKYWLSDEPSLHCDALRFAEEHKNLGHRIQEFVVRCDCQYGATKGNLLPHTEYLSSDPPVREPAEEGMKMRAIACRQYVTGTGKRYHPDDTRPPAKGSSHIRFFNSPGPEEKHGPIRGAEVRRDVAAGGSSGARRYLRSNLRR